jgi:enoyl-CoA hydratase/carnithine racemase
VSPSSFINHFVKDGVGQIVLNRPECRNAITTDMWRSIPDLIDLMCRNDAGAIVVRGAGGAFAAGADLAELELLRSFQAAEETWNAISNALGALSECMVPTIAMIDGPCIGGGCLLAIACDLRYATARSLFAVPVAKLGIIIDDASVARLAAIVGSASARELLMRGNVISAHRAYEKGLVNELTEDQTALEQLISKVTEELLENSATSIDACRKSVARVCGLNSLPSMEDPSAIIESYLTEDFRLRIAKALDK